MSRFKATLVLALTAPFLLAFASDSPAAEAKFFPIERAPKTQYLPVAAHGAGQNVPTQPARFLPIKRTDRTGPMPVRPAPAKAQIGSSNGLPPVTIRSGPASLGIAAMLSDRPAFPLFDAAVHAAPGALDPMPRDFAREIPGVSDHIWPIDPGAESRVTSNFGWRTDPFTGEPAFHGAVDIAAAKGSIVVATSHGVVHAVGDHPRLGRYVMLSYRDGSTATYGHLRDYIVETGQLVHRGQAIGHVGSTGRSTGPHVDFRLEIDGRRIDPLPLLRRPDTIAAR